MAWIDDYEDSDEVIIEQATVASYIMTAVQGDATPPKWKLTETTTKKHRTSLTFAAAQAALAYYNALDNTTAIIRRGGEANQYICEAMEHSYELVDETEE